MYFKSVLLWSVSLGLVRGTLLLGYIEIPLLHLTLLFFITLEVMKPSWKLLQKPIVAGRVSPFKGLSKRWKKFSARLIVLRFLVKDVGGCRCLLI